MVEWKKLGEIAEITIGEFVHKNKQNPNGKYPVYNGGIAPTGFYDNYNNTENKIVISARGATAGFVNMVLCKYWAGNSSYSIDVHPILSSWLFVFYYLKSYQSKLISDQQKGGGIPSISKKQVQDILIPIPSLEEQNRIVGILDTFTASIDNLKEQIAQRRKQYEYYRDQLLDLEGKEGVEMKMLGELCSKLTDGSHFSPKSVEHGYFMPSVKDMTNNGFDFSNCKQVSKEDYEYLIRTGCKPQINDVLIAKDGSMLKYVFPIVKDEEIVVLSSIAILTPRTNFITSSYLSHYLKCAKIREKTIREFSSKGGVPRIILKNFKKICICFPSLQEQQRIVSILDTFEASIQNLEAQLSQREKQYEYYRNKLLTFE